MLCRLRNFSKGWIKDEKASTAIEFSLLIIPYMLLTLAIVELSIMYASAAMLEGATNSAARMIKTGQLQQTQGRDPKEMFTEAVCNYASVLINCDRIVIEVMRLNNFTDYESMEPQYDEDGNMISQGFDPGGSNDKILIRASYRYNMLTPFVGPLLAGADNKQTFISTVVLQTEPYLFDGSA